MAMEGVRVRLAFEDRHILSKPLRKQGLKRCWILLKPHHGTISDITADLLHSFELNRTCPRGVVLSMDGFVLPPFESTSILKDKDVIWVKKKGGNSHEKIKWDHGDNILEEIEYLQEQPARTTLKLLANEEFQKEVGGYESESEDDEENVVTEDAVSKKRKASKKIKSPKRKKRKFADAEESPAVLEGAVNDKPIEEESPQDGVLAENNPREKNKSSHKKTKKDKLSTTNHDGTDIVVPEGTSQSPVEIQGSVDASPKPDKPKLPSRSARRKKAKRHWIAEMRKIGSDPEARKRQTPGNDDWRKKFLGDNNNTLPTKNSQAPSEDQRKSAEEQEQVHQGETSTKEHHQPHEKSCENDDIVPVVIKPGHIRFGPVDEVAGQSVDKDQVQMNYQWNGITSKKRGQKWGTEKAASKWSIYEAVNAESAQEPAAEKEMHPSVNSDLMNFNEFPPYGPLPKEGETIAYRVIELSSSWTPEISPFRVGKITSCAQGRKSYKVTLVPVPEYPFDMENIDKSLYREDGSLEVDFSALVDVRSLDKEKCDNGAAQTAIAETNGTPPPAEDPNAAKWGAGDNNNNKNDAAATPTKGNAQVSVWDEISETLSAKKAQLSQEDRWGKKDGVASSSGIASGGGSGSGTIISGGGRGNGNTGVRGRGRGLRVARGSALGPVMALLRAQNGI